MPVKLVAADDWPALEETALNPVPLGQRPDLEAAQKRVRAAEADRDLARAKKAVT
jgi:cobalt-zinc-cadmium efflux system outer membrane protein